MVNRIVVRYNELHKMAVLHIKSQPVFPELTSQEGTIEFQEKSVSNGNDMGNDLA
jgi:hypothetical protein